jgi:hypothetical protein
MAGPFPNTQHKGISRGWTRPNGLRAAASSYSRRPPAHGFSMAGIVRRATNAGQPQQQS